MQLRTVVHRRFRDESGTEFLYLANSAAILALDDATAGVVDAFVVPEGVDSESWLQQQTKPAAAEATLHDLIDLGAIRPTDESAAPRAQLPPMPFPLATLMTFLGITHPRRCIRTTPTARTPARHRATRYQSCTARWASTAGSCRRCRDARHRAP